MGLQESNGGSQERIVILAGGLLLISGEFGAESL